MGLLYLLLGGYNNEYHEKRDISIDDITPDIYIIKVW